MNEPDYSENTQPHPQAKNKIVLLWVLTLFFNVVPGYLFYRFKQSDPYIQEQAKQALNWSITILIGVFIAVLLSFFIGSFLIPVVGIIHFVFCLKGAIATWLDEPFQVPFAVRLVK